MQGSAGDAFGGFGFGSGMITAVQCRNSAPGMPRAAMMPAAMRPTALGGLFGGYAWQIGPFVYGVEADVDDATNLKRPVSSTTPGFGFEGLDPAFPVIRAKADVFGTARARVGYAFERYLVYASFGLAALRSGFSPTSLDPGTTSAPALRRGRAFLGSRSVPASSMPSPRTSRWDWNTATSTSAGADGSISAPFRRHRAPSPRGPPSPPTKSSRACPGIRVVLVLPPEPGEVAPHDPDTAISDRVSLHGQTTFVDQGVSGFRSPYLGPQSLVPRQARATLTATAFLGFKLTDSTELYYNPEFDQGFGLSRTLGVAGFVNGEAQKAGAPFPKSARKRYFVRQTFGLGGETEDVPTARTSRDASRHRADHDRGRKFALATSSTATPTRTIPASIPELVPGRPGL